jgi:hypothetical protein
MPWTQMLLGFVVSLTSVGLKGFQHKNVIGDHYKLVFFTSYLMAVMDVAWIGLVATNGWAMAVPMGTGAACGMVGAMLLHKRFVKKVEP